MYRPYISLRYIYPTGRRTSTDPGTSEAHEKWSESARPRPRGVGRWAREVNGIQRRAVRVPRDTYDALRAVAFATGEDVATLVHQALQDFMATEGHRRAVAGFASREGRRHRA